MKSLAEIQQKDIDLTNKKNVKYRIRKAARAVLFNKEGKIALLFVSKNNYHKLPGGGLKEGEDITSALKREVMEETGCTFTIGDEVGEIVEFRDEFELHQFSYCFIAKVKEIQQKPSFTKREALQEFQLKWIDLDEAIKILEKDKPKNYEGKFIRQRDLIFLKKAKEIMSKN